MAYPYSAAPGYGPPPQVQRRRRRWPWVLLVVLVLLVAVAVVVDRVALKLAEDKAAESLQSSQNLRQKPDVSVAGFPFLTQLAAGEFDNVTIDAPDVVVGEDRTLRLADVTVHLHHVTVYNSYRSVRADTATADARIDYADLSQTLGTTVRGSNNGRITAEPSVHVLGQTFSGTVSASVHASSDTGITFTDPKVTAAGITLPDVASQALAAVFAKPISLAGLPFSIRVTGVDVTSSAVVLHLSGRNLTYTRS